MQGWVKQATIKVTKYLLHSKYGNFMLTLCLKRKAHETRILKVRTYSICKDFIILQLLRLIC